MLALTFKISPPELNLFGVPPKVKTRCPVKSAMIYLGNPILPLFTGIMREMRYRVGENLTTINFLFPSLTFFRKTDWMAVILTRTKSPTAKSSCLWNRSNLCSFTFFMIPAIASIRGWSSLKYPYQVLGSLTRRLVYIGIF